MKRTTIPTLSLVHSEVLSGGRKEDAGDRAILLQSSGNLESLKKASEGREGLGRSGEVFDYFLKFLLEDLC